jgi:hypothetical protein
MVSPVQLLTFPGAPFTPELVEAAEASIRSDAGWHIAPVITETIAVRVVGREVILPSLNVVSVTAVNGLTAGWEILPGGILRWNSAYGPVLSANASAYVGGRGTVAHITLTHGFEACPADLLPVVAARAQMVAQATPAVQSETTGPYSVTYRQQQGATDVPSRYRLSSGVA